LQDLQDLDHVPAPIDLVRTRLDIAVEVTVPGVQVENRFRVDQARPVQGRGHLVEGRAGRNDEPGRPTARILWFVQLLVDPIEGQDPWDTDERRQEEQDDENPREAAAPAAGPRPILDGQLAVHLAVFVVGLIVFEVL
jgi:hypothetical protein